MTNAPAPAASAPAFAPAAPRARRLGAAAMGLAIGALVVALGTAVLHGLVVTSGRSLGEESFSDLPGGPAGSLILTFRGIQAAVSCVGLAALGLGIAATVTDRGRGRGIAAIVLTVAGPLLTYAVYSAIR